MYEIARNEDRNELFINTASNMTLYAEWNWDCTIAKSDELLF